MTDLCNFFREAGACQEGLWKSKCCWYRQAQWSWAEWSTLIRDLLFGTKNSQVIVCWFSFWKAWTSDKFKRASRLFNTDNFGQFILGDYFSVMPTISWGFCWIDNNLQSWKSLAWSQPQIVLSMSFITITYILLPLTVYTPSWLMLTIKHHHRRHAFSESLILAFSTISLKHMLTSVGICPIKSYGIVTTNSYTSRLVY